MVGLVLVSHSDPLAQALIAMIRQAAGPRLPVAAAAGTGDPAHPFGTDAQRVRAAIEAVDGSAANNGEGVLVLVDLGSALLSADLALELLEPRTAGRVRLCGAPLVEGALAAASRAAAGGSLAEVAAEAEAALGGKQGPAGERAGAAEPAGRRQPRRPRLRWRVPGAAGRAVLPNRLGLHLRPAAAFVREASRHRAAVRVSLPARGTPPAEGLSLNRLVLLGARQGEELLIEAQGEDAPAAVAALAASGAGRRFGGGGGRRATPLPVAPPGRSPPPGPPAPPR